MKWQMQHLATPGKYMEILPYRVKPLFIHVRLTKIRKISSVSVFCQQESVASPFGLVQVSLGESLAGESKGHLLGNSQGHKCSVRTLWPNELQTSASVHRNTPLSHGLTLPQPLQQHLFRNLCAVIPRETGSIKACNYIFEPIDTYSIYYKYAYIHIYIYVIYDISIVFGCIWRPSGSQVVFPNVAEHPKKRQVWSVSRMHLARLEHNPCKHV